MAVTKSSTKDIQYQLYSLTRILHDVASISACKPLSPYVRIVVAARRRGGVRHCGAEVILLPQSVVHLPKSFGNILSNKKHLINLLAQMHLISPPSMAMVYGAIAKRQLSLNQQRHWRTRKDPFELVWSNEIEPMLNGRT